MTRLFVTGDVAGPAHYHLGDEAMLEANLRMFRRFLPELQFTVSSKDPAWTSVRYGVESVPSPHLRRFHPDPPPFVEGHSRAAGDSLRVWEAWLGEEIVTQVRESQGVVISGGGNLRDIWPAHVWERVALLQVARAAGRPAVVLGQTLGPDLTDHRRGWLGDSLSSCAWVGVREAASAELARSLGVPADRIGPQLDDAFFMEPTTVHDDRMQPFDRLPGPWILVTFDAGFGTSPRAHTLGLMAAQLDALADRLQASLVFVPHVAGVAVPDEASDLVAAHALRAQLRSPLLVLDAWQPREMLWLVSRAALVVSTRYHSIVFATAAGTPSIGIYADEYTRTKLHGALAHAGLERWCLSADAVERNELLPLTMALWREREDVTRTLADLRARAWPLELRRWQGICRALGLEAQQPGMEPS